MRETCPAILQLLWLCRFAQSEIDNAVLGEVLAKNTHTSRSVWLERQPDEAIGANTEEFHAVVIAMFDAEAEAR